VAPLAAALLLAGCDAGRPRPRPDLLRRSLAETTGQQHPSLGGRWLALVASRRGRERVVLIDLAAGRPVPLPGLNRPDARPISVSVDGRGERIAVVRQRQQTTELVLYRRATASTGRLPLQTGGVPRRVALRADGRQLAVQVSRDGRWQVDLIPVP
jgi:Tol biopolymer transport system component